MSEAVVLLEAAAEALRRDILAAVRQQQGCGDVPCQDGLRRFAGLVNSYWRLLELGGELGGGPVRLAQPEAMCEVER